MWFVWHNVAYNVYVFRYAYSQDGQPTIVPKNNKNIKLGQSSSLSRIDKLKINKLYNCGRYQTSWTSLYYFRARIVKCLISLCLSLQVTRMITDQTELRCSRNVLKANVIINWCLIMQTNSIKFDSSFLSAFLLCAFNPVCLNKVTQPILRRLTKASRTFCCIK